MTKNAEICRLMRAVVEDIVPRIPDDIELSKDEFATLVDAHTYLGWIRVKSLRESEDFVVKGTEFLTRVRTLLFPLCRDCGHNIADREMYQTMDAVKKFLGE